MPRFSILKSSNINRTPRVMQIEGIFDVEPSKTSEVAWSGDFEFPQDWQIGAIVGPSGSGKSTIAREIFGDCLIDGFDWPVDKSVVDGFDKRLSIKDVTGALSSVGFSSPPSWLRPYSVLSNGEKFRATLARALTLESELIVIDEFTSVVDRTVAQIGSAAVSKAVRRSGKKFVAVSCHYDILDWLEPDWVYQPHTGEYYTGRYLHRRPKIELKIKRVHTSAWQLFRKHHYLDTTLHTAARCFCAFLGDQPVAFTAILHFPHPKSKNVKREHRTVCLPDYQGVGIGNAMSDYIGAMCKGLGFRWQSSTSNPAMIHARNRSKNWAMFRSPTFSTGGRKSGAIGGGSRSTRQTSPWRGVNNRFTASFEYIGPALDKSEAVKVWG